MPMPKLPKLSISIIKDVIYIVSIIIAVFFYFRDKAVRGAVLETQIKTMITTQESILEKIKEIDVKFEKQSEINGKVLMYIELDSK